jgi:hypothetical protein
MASALLALAGLPACVDIDGGAVEVAWAIFAEDGRAINDCSCSEPGIAYVRLHLVADPDASLQPCADNPGCRFSCGRKIGATPFSIPPGQYLMSLIAVDTNGVDVQAGSVRSPPAQSRAVVRGQPTQLEAFMLETTCRAECNKGPAKPCTK